MPSRPPGVQLLLAVAYAASLCSSTLSREAIRRSVTWCRIIASVFWRATQRCAPMIAAAWQHLQPSPSG